jgi:hypothetical protein
VAILRVVVKEALNCNGTTFTQLADVFNGRNEDAIYKNNENDVNKIIDCLGWHQSKTKD